MASLELIPNPQVPVVQAGIFLANLVVVKKLWVEPYLTVRDRREKMTAGSKDDATRFLADAERLSEEINAKLKSAAGEAKSHRETIRNAALARRAQILAAAESEAKAHVDTVERQIKDELTRERSKVPAIVQTLTDDVYKLALS